MILLAALLAILTIAFIGGCARLKQLDAELWATEDPSGEQQEAPGVTMLEGVAAILALGGYGGMATWIGKSNKNGKKTIAALEARIADLEQHDSTK